MCFALELFKEKADFSLENSCRNTSHEGVSLHFAPFRASIPSLNSFSQFSLQIELKIGTNAIHISFRWSNRKWKTWNRRSVEVASLYFRFGCSLLDSLGARC